MAKAKAQQEQELDEDLALGPDGRPLPAVRLRDKQGREVVVRDAGGLSNLHYGEGMDFADEGVTYASALAHILGEEVASQVLVDVPADGGDVVWPGGSQDQGDADDEKSD
jgi:hypothetical protein